MRGARHGGRLLRALPLGLLLLLAVSIVRAQQASDNFAPGDRSAAPTVPRAVAAPKIEMSASDITEIVLYFRTKDASRSVMRFQSRMPLPVTDAKFRQTIYDNLPPVVKKLRLVDSEIIAQFKKVVAPVLSLYERENVYDMIIVQTPKPFIFIDGGVALVVSTGLIERIESDDELLGLIAHEIAHEYFAEYSFHTKQILKAIAEGDREPALEGKYLEALSLIELHCDAFAALSLAHLKRRPLSFIDAIKRFESDYPAADAGFHPPNAMRRRLIEQLIPKTSLAEAKSTSALKNLKRTLPSNNLIR